MAGNDYASGPFAQQTTLPNGVRVLTERLAHVDSVSLGLWAASGVADDPAGAEGVTHLIEHMLFKGTPNRPSRRIAEAIDEIGGNVNGVTDREFMYLYARTTRDHLETALDLLLDLFLHSACAAEDLKREKEVVLQEIHLIEDAPEDWVHDLLLETAWPGHPLGKPVIGRAVSVKGITRKALSEHLARLRVGRNLLVTAAGRVGHEEMVAAVARLTEHLPPGEAKPAALAPEFHPGRLLISRPTNQVHFCLATPACHQTDPERHAFAVLDTILGGGTSSRLFHEIRETRGLAYNIGSYLQLFRTAGLFTVDAGTSPENFQLVQDLIGEEIARLQADGPTAAEVERAKTQVRVAVALAEESTSFRMQHLAISELFWGRTLSFDEIIAGVAAVSAEDVHSTARQVFAPERTTLVAIGPFEEANLQEESR
jgi:predicted Zn-dependent peptidase